MEDFFHYEYISPIGTIEILGSEKGIRSLSFLQEGKWDKPIPKCLKDCIKQLDEYFNRKRQKFSLKLDIQGTPFQLKVWNELLKIQYGKTCSYIDLARKLGNEKWVRAVGNVNGKNKIPIIIPCHRVIGNNNSLIGYAGGLERKKWLLDFEKPMKQLYLF
jgi:methylated-DNA-[protein]-cysteine S-methyltransferase